MCQKLNIPQEHAPVVLALIERVCQNSAELMDSEEAQSQFIKDLNLDPNYASHICPYVTLNSKTAHR